MLASGVSIRQCPTTLTVCAFGRLLGDFIGNASDDVSTISPEIFPDGRLREFFMLWALYTCDNRLGTFWCGNSTPLGNEGQLSRAAWFRTAMFFIELGNNSGDWHGSPKKYCEGNSRADCRGSIILCMPCVRVPFRRR